MDKNEIISALEPLIKALDDISIPYFIGGSIASSAYGLARATMDVDMILNLKPFQVQDFVNKLKGDFFVDEEMIIQAIKTDTSFNILHLPTMLKIDFFILKKQPYQIKSFERRKLNSLEDSRDSVKIFLCSPEDIIISKLEWFRLSNETSERQWLDILGVIKVQSDSLDKNYLKYWAKELNLFELLQKAFGQAEVIL